MIHAIVFLVASSFAVPSPVQRMPEVTIIGKRPEKAWTCGDFRPTALGTQVRDCDWR